MLIQLTAHLNKKDWLPSIILILFFISGCCSLIYEVAWMRLLTLIFGMTAVATSTVLASFMAGLALGSYIFGRIADTKNRPLRLYSLLELGIGIFALLLPSLLSSLDNVYVFLFRQFGASFPLISFIRFLLSFTILLLPATLMGGTLPIISRFIANRWNKLGWSIGRLYFVNTLGGAAGTLLAGFALILLLGVRETTYVAAALNIIIAAVALVIDHQNQKGKAAESIEQSSETPLAESKTCQVYSPGTSRLVLAAFGAAGFSSLALEVLWTRSLVFILDNTTHAFTTMLSAFLTGIAVGSMIMARFTDNIRRPVLWLGIIICGIGVSAIISVPIFINLAAEIGGGSYQPDNYWQWASLRFGRSFLVMLLPTLLMGMAFPLVSKIYTKSPAILGKSIGSVYALNTLGGVAGSLVAGFLLVPLIGVYYSIAIIAGLYTITGVILLATEPFTSIRSRIKSIALPSFSFLLAAILVISPGRLIFSSSVERQETETLLYYDEGIGSTVKVYANELGYRYLSIDGFPVASTAPRHRDIQHALGHLPLLLSSTENPSVCVIGLGAGGSSWAVTRYNIEKLDVVELVPSVVEAAKLLPEINYQLFRQPDFNLTLADGRNYLLVTGEKYDVISVDATSPKGSGNGSLYSLEFYKSCRQSMAEDGVLAQWLPFHLLNEAETGMIINTFREVFPNASLWFSPLRNYFLLIGTMDEFQIDFLATKAKIEQPVIQKELRSVLIHDIYDFLSCFVMAGDALAEYAGNARLNTDNHPYLEYAPSLTYFQMVDFTRENILKAAPLRHWPAPYLVNMGQNHTEVLTLLAERFAQTPVERYWPLFFE